MEKLFPNYLSVEALYRDSTEKFQYIGVKVAGFDENGEAYVVHDSKLMLAKDVTFDELPHQFTELSKGFSMHETIVKAVYEVLPYAETVCNTIYDAVKSSMPTRSDILEAIRRIKP